MENKSTRDGARADCLQAIQRYAPQVLSSLKNDVLPPYLAFDLSTAEASRDWWAENLMALARDGQDLDQAFNFLPTLLHPALRFEIAICSWARTHYLTDAWLFHEAIATLNLWRQSGLTDSWAYAQSPLEMYDSKQAFRFAFDPWDRNADTWSSYKKKVNAACKVLKSRYPEA